MEASNLGLRSLLLSHKKDAILIWVIWLSFVMFNCVLSFFHVVFLVRCGA